jgi:uncharacterized UBP type Zn finger protein
MDLLISMGYHETVAKEALTRFDNDVEQALAYLLGNGKRFSQ